MKSTLHQQVLKRLGGAADVPKPVIMLNSVLLHAVRHRWVSNYVFVVLRIPALVMVTSSLSSAVTRWNSDCWTPAEPQEFLARETAISKKSRVNLSAISVSLLVILSDDRAPLVP